MILTTLFCNESHTDTECSLFRHWHEAVAPWRRQSGCGREFAHKASTAGDQPSSKAITLIDMDRLVLGFCALFINVRRARKRSVLLQPSI